MENNWLEPARERFAFYKLLAERAMAQLDDEDAFHWTPGAESNTLGVMIKHLAGNMESRWTNFLTSDGEKPWRDRKDEFEDLGESREQLMARWQSGWTQLFKTLDQLTSADLSKIVYVDKQPLTVPEAVFRQLTHYAYHVGQMVYLARMIKGATWESLSIPKSK